MSRTRIVLALALAAFATVSAAQDRRPGYGPDVTLATAKKIAAGTIAECQKNGWNVSVAVVDNHGYLVYFERMEDTQYARSEQTRIGPPGDAHRAGRTQPGGRYRPASA